MKNAKLVATVVSLMVSLPLALAEETQKSADRKNSREVVKVAHISGMDKLPEILTQVAPIYPSQLRERGIQGVVTVQMLIDSTGRVIEAVAVRSTTPGFTVMAMEAARKWTFTPAEADGKKIMSRVMVPFEFTMPQVAALEER